MGDPMGWLQVGATFFAVLLAWRLAERTERRRIDREINQRKKDDAQVARGVFDGLYRAIEDGNQDIEMLAPKIKAMKPSGFIGLDNHTWLQSGPVLQVRDDNYSLQRDLAIYFGDLESLASLARRYDRLLAAYAQGLTTDGSLVPRDWISSIQSEFDRESERILRLGRELMDRLAPPAIS